MNISSIESSPAGRQAVTMGALMSALCLAGCATPTYPTDVAAGHAATATASSAPGDQVPPPAAVQPDPAAAEPASVAAPAPAPVVTSPLPPATGAASSAGLSTPAPSTATPVSPVVTAVPPTYSPPPASAVEIAPPAPAAPVLSTPAPSPTRTAAPVRTPSAQPSVPPRQTALVAPRTSSPPRPALRYRQTPGREIAGGRVVVATGMFRDYLVQPRDHLDAIARDLGASRKVLVDANHLKPPYALQPGQHLKVPVAKAYEVRAGDTLAEVAKRFSLTPTALAELNDLPEKARLRAGDRLALPDRFDDRGPTRLAGALSLERVAVAAPARPRAYPTGPAVAASTYAQPRADGAPYVPSPAALAAAQRLSISRSYGPPSYGPGRPSPNAALASRSYGPSAYSATPYQPPAYQASEFGGRSPASVAALGRGRFIWPVRGAIISTFGVQGVGRRNDGIDIRSPAGSPVRVAAAGEVVYAGNEVPGFGNLVLVKHPDGWVTAYAHLASIGVQMRQSVAQGQTLGDVGATGSAPEAQLHFEVRYAATPVDKPRPVDPMLVLPR